MYLDWFEREISERLREQPIGRPVCARGFFQLTSDHGLLTPLLAAAIDMAARWFASPPARLYAQGGARAGYTSALVEFQAGQTAVLTAELARAAEPWAMLLLVGNRGTLRYTDLPLAILREAPAGRLGPLIEKSLRARETVAV
ncbi:MAG: hypothetical protein FJW37_07215 [Acidobacteria bacterium]|nr:hypothetical protein [Acidobacteriota bacterium]